MMPVVITLMSLILCIIELSKGPKRDFEELYPSLTPLGLKRSRPHTVISPRTNRKIIRTRPPSLIPVYTERRKNVAWRVGSGEGGGWVRSGANFGRWEKGVAKIRKKWVVMCPSCPGRKWYYIWTEKGFLATLHYAREWKTKAKTS